MTLSFLSTTVFVLPAVYKITIRIQDLPGVVFKLEFHFEGSNGLAAGKNGVLIEP
jgi:hypothetical protein